MFCLPDKVIEEVKLKFKSGEFDPGKLIEMTSEERRAAFSEVMGEMNAKSANALFESKLLLKNQQAGIINWAKQVAGMKPDVLRDIITRVNRMTEVLEPKKLDTFLNDLASQKLGMEVTLEEAGKISQLAKDVSDKRTKIKEDSLKGSAERLDYGLSLALFKEYTGKLKLDAKTVPFMEKFKSSPGDAIGALKDAVVNLGGIAKSVKAAYDNSFFGRQGIKVLLTNPDIWTKNFLKSWKDIGRELKGTDAITPIRADVWSRPNAVNGRYEKMKLDIGLKGEEAFPSSLPEKIPVLRRLYKASESAYNGAALRMRADLADRLLKKAESMGIDMKSKAQLESIGNLVNAMTGRGKTTKTDIIGKEVNSLFFSYKFLKSNFDTITAHSFQKDVTPFVRKQAAGNLLKIVGTIAAIQATANQLWPDSVDKDHPGRIKVGGVWIDISGGMGSLASLALKINERIQNQTGKYGEQDATDIFWNFWEGKLSPIAGVVRDYARGKTYDGDKPTIVNQAVNLFLPLPNVQAIKLNENDKSLAFMIADGIGFSVSIPFKDNWTQNPGVELKQFWDAVGDDKFKEANKQFNKEYEQWLNDMQSNESYGSMSSEEKQKAKTRQKEDIKDSIFKSNNFKYKQGKLPKIEAGKPQSESGIINAVATYAKAVNSNPVAAFDRIFSGQKILRADNGAIFVERMPLQESEAVKRERGSTTEMRLDHTIPLELGGSNDKDNLILVPVEEWKKFTPIENYLGRLLKTDTISQDLAQELIRKFKAGDITEEELKARTK